MTYTITYQSPLGPLALTATPSALVGLEFGEIAETGHSSLLQQAAAELDEYFQGVRTRFSVPLSATGTPFQEAVWEALLTIPYGQTRSYGQIAAQIANPKASRAVGMANNRNPISIIIPCHRVIGSDGSLVGYGGGMEKKVWLLDFEARRHRP